MTLNFVSQKIFLVLAVNKNVLIELKNNNFRSFERALEIEFQANWLYDRASSMRLQDGKTLIEISMLLLLLSAAEGQRPRNYSSCCCWIFHLIYALSTPTTVLPLIFPYVSHPLSHSSFPLSHSSFPLSHSSLSLTPPSLSLLHLPSSLLPPSPYSQSQNINIKSPQTREPV